MENLKAIDDWPDEVSQRYERIEALGKGSFGMVWMARRTVAARDKYDDEYVAIKSITIKDEKGRVYAEREISILHELIHPHIIRLIQAAPVYKQNRVVVMQLARGPNLHQLVMKRGALGIPLARLVSRHLISAVGYLHGRACIHRDIKPSNCILACTAVSSTEEYDWYEDDAIWSNDNDASEAIKKNRWKLMLVDFGFARALEEDEVRTRKHLRNSIVYETDNKMALPSEKTNAGAAIAKNAQVSDDDEVNEDEDNAIVQKLFESGAMTLRSSYVATNEVEDAIMGGGHQRRRESGVSMPLPEPAKKQTKRTSTARLHVRSMSALGTKAYAAPEIRKKLRHKTQDDLEKENAAMTECVADYGMNVDAYSVGWTLRVAMTGVPPNFTIAEYMRERENVVMEGEGDVDHNAACCCFPPYRDDEPKVVVRDPASLPHDATVLMKKLTEKNPEERMTIREAQNHSWIKGEEEEHYTLPQGDFPSHHGDPVVPLRCARELSKLTIDYHMQ